MNDTYAQLPPVEFMGHFAEFAPLTTETIPLVQARGRVLAEPLVSGETLPPFSRSLMDGYAVRASDTRGASASNPVRLAVIGEIVTGSSGQALTLAPGQAVRISTGGELPQEADAVVMIEQTNSPDRQTVAVCRPVAPAENVTGAGEDCRPGTVVLEANRRLRPQDLGLLASLGIGSVPVHRQPRVAILSTGDELVPPEQTPPPGKVRNVNSTTLTALVEEAGGLPLPGGICPDDFDRLLARCTEALARADVLLLTGGSSMGKRDFTGRVFAAIPGAEVLVHGVSVRPGKPTILARQSNKALFGLPGHAASALIGFICFVRPLLRHYTGLGATLGLPAVRAILGQSLSSAIGREDYVRVRLEPQANGMLPLVLPVPGKPGLLSPLVRADGLLPIGRDIAGLDQGTEATVLLFP